MSHKIAFVLNTAWNAYNFRKGLIKHFLSRDFEVVIIAPHDEYVNNLNSWGARCIDVNLEKSGMNPASDYSYLRSLKKILKKEQPDITLTFTIKSNIYGSIACSSLKIPVINNVSGLGTTFLWKGWLQKLASGLYQHAFTKSSFIFFQNKDDRELFLENVRIPQSKTGLLPGSGVDLAHFNAPIPDFTSRVKILMVSRLIIDKGVREYMDAAEVLTKENANVEFLLAGGYDPTHKRSISEQEFDKLKKSKSTSYLGKIDNVKSSIEEAELIVLTSYREGTPRTLLEGAAMSRPLIATDVPGCREVVEDGVNGFLCEKGSTDSLSRKIRLFLSLSVEEKKQMSIASRKLVEKSFDESIVIGLYQDKINELTQT